MTAVTLFERSNQDWSVRVVRRHRFVYSRVARESLAFRAVEMDVWCTQDADSSPATLSPDDADLLADALRQGAQILREHPEVEGPL